MSPQPGRRRDAGEVPRSRGPLVGGCILSARPSAGSAFGVERFFKSSHYINNRQPITGSLSKVLSKLAVEVRVDGENERKKKT